VKEAIERNLREFGARLCVDFVRRTKETNYLSFQKESGLVLLVQYSLCSVFIERCYRRDNSTPDSIFSLLLVIKFVAT